MAQPHLKSHPYHLVDPSPWPFIGGLAALTLCLGAVLLMHGYGFFVLSVGGGLLILTMAGWWHDMAKEATPVNHTAPVRHGLRMGVVLFIASEVMFFVAFFWAFFDASLFPKEAAGGVWPPQGVHVLDPFDLPYLNTLILLLSGTTLTWAHQALLEKHKKEVLQGMGLTILLGLTFSGLQMYEYAHATFPFKGNIYGSTFYMATGFHGVHVIVGTLFLAICWVRAWRDQFTPQDHVGFEAAAWYWHFVDVVWIFLFLAIYWWGSGGGIS